MLIIGINIGVEKWSLIRIYLTFITDSDKGFRERAKPTYLTFLHYIGSHFLFLLLDSFASFIRTLRRFHSLDVKCLDFLGALGALRGTSTLVEATKSDSFMFHYLSIASYRAHK